MIIVMGHLTVPAKERDAYLRTCEEVVRLARDAPGCLDFAVSADLAEPTRVNVMERWADRGSLEAFRADGPSAAQVELIESASVGEYAARELGQP